METKAKCFVPGTVDYVWLLFKFDWLFLQDVTQKQDSQDLLPRNEFRGQPKSLIIDRGATHADTFSIRFIFDLNDNMYGDCNFAGSQQ